MPENLIGSAGAITLHVLYRGGDQLSPHTHQFGLARGPSLSPPWLSMRSRCHRARVAAQRKSARSIDTVTES
jgi:hypothetical protein